MVISALGAMERIVRKMCSKRSILLLFLIPMFSSISNEELEINMICDVCDKTLLNSIDNS